MRALALFLACSSLALCLVLRCGPGAGEDTGILLAGWGWVSFFAGAFIIHDRGL